MDGVQSFWTAYADDFKVCTYFRGGSSSERGDQLQRDLDRVCQVAGQMNLKLNPAKCSVVHFGRCKSADVSNVYYVDGVALRGADSSRDLGVVVDSNLKWHDHIQSIVGKAGGLMSSLLRTTVCRSTEFMTALYVANIRPLLDFSSTVWNVGYLMDARRLESVQRRWTREVEGLRGLDVR